MGRSHGRGEPKSVRTGTGELNRDRLCVLIGTDNSLFLTVPQELLFLAVKPREYEQSQTHPSATTGVPRPAASLWIIPKKLFLPVFNYKPNGVDNSVSIKFFETLGGFSEIPLNPRQDCRWRCLIPAQAAFPLRSSRVPKEPA